PGKAKDVAIAGENQRALAWDNVSAITPTMADVLCRRATGDGIEVRGLYTDRDLCVLVGSNPIILNTIVDVVFERPDLLSRALFLEVRGGKRLTDEAVAERFEELHARAFGALCY